MKSVESTGDIREGVSSGVGGKAGVVVEAGVGRKGRAVGGMIGKVRDSLFVLLEVVEADRAERVSIRSPMCEGGGEIGSSGKRRGLVSSRLPPRLGWRLASGVEIPFRIFSSMDRWSNTISSIFLGGAGLGYSGFGDSGLR
jgi:hypothetical protein